MSRSTRRVTSGWKSAHSDESFDSPPSTHSRAFPASRPASRDRMATITLPAPLAALRSSASAQSKAAAPTAKAAATANGPVDYPLLAVLATLLALGLVMVYSASMVRAQLYNHPATYFFIRQIAWIGIGVAVLVVMMNIRYRFWQRLAIPIMGVALLALVAVLVFGDSRYGAQRTLLNGSVQPSEFVKLAVVIYVAAWVASKKNHLAEVQGGLIPFAVLMGIVAGLIVLEHSFSVTIIILVTGTTVFFVGGGNARQLALTGIIAAAVLALLIWQSNYAYERVHTWWNTLSDPSMAPYDVSQAWAIIRQGHGIDTRPDNWMLKGTVPLLWSDFLFANVGADLGFPGTLGVVILFAVLGYRGLGIALNAPDQFAGLTAIGITTWLLTQALIHIGASLALIPTTGVPLPFMSYGGSSMIASMAAIGLLLNISRASPLKRASYADYSLGWGNRRPRLPNLGRGQRTTTAKHKSGTHSGAGRPGSSRAHTESPTRKSTTRSRQSTGSRR